MLGLFIRRCFIYQLHLKTAFTVYSERYRWWVKTQFYRRHADPSAKHLFSLTVSHLLHHPYTA